MGEKTEAMGVKVDLAILIYYGDKLYTFQTFFFFNLLWGGDREGERE